MGYAIAVHSLAKARRGGAFGRHSDSSLVIPDHVIFTDSTGITNDMTLQKGATDAFAHNRSQVPADHLAYGFFWLGTDSTVGHTSASIYPRFGSAVGVSDSIYYQLVSGSGTFQYAPRLSTGSFDTVAANWPSSFTGRTITSINVLSWYTLP